MHAAATLTIKRASCSQLPKKALFNPRLINGPGGQAHRRRFTLGSRRLSFRGPRRQGFADIEDLFAAWSNHTATATLVVLEENGQ